MSQKYSGRLTAIVAVLVLALYAIFPSPAKLFSRNVPWGEKTALKPGIDMVGGTSLLYEIKAPEGGSRSIDLASDVMRALKRRVDPQGVKNLIWRPQGTNRLEIQMPVSAGSIKAQESRKELGAAQAALDATNIRPEDAIDAAEEKNGRTRAELERMAMGSPARAKLFAEMTRLYDRMRELHAANDLSTARELAQVRSAYEAITSKADPATGRTKLADTNVTPAELDRVLASEPAKREASLKSLRAKAAGFAARQEALDRYVRAYDEFKKVKGSIDDAAELKRQLRGSGVLEFHILVDPSTLPSSEVKAMVERLKRDGPRLQAGDRYQWFEVERPKEFHEQMATGDDGKKYALAWITPDKSLDNREGKEHWALESAYPTQGEFNERVVGFHFDNLGGKYFGELTGANINKPLAIMLDGKIISAPNIHTRIGSTGQIDGGRDGYTASELEYLVHTLDAGSLPAQLAEEPISERTVGSTLGADNLRKGLISCGLGLVIVAVFLIGYYYLSGVVATLAVFMNVVLILGVMAMLRATFTLPSIAGIVLTIGTAVDANVLIFERLREEQMRGLSLKLALRNAYDRALSAIVDSNMTTAITSFFLILFGTEEVKGFGYTLLIGIAMSLFTALFVTRTIFNLMIDRFGITRLGSLPMTFPRWDRFLKPHIDWMRMAGGFYAFSAVAVTAGLILFVHYARAGQMMDIEFAAGTSVQFELKQPMTIERVRGLFADADANVLPSPSIVSVGNEQTVYEVVTPNADSARVKDVVLKALGDRLAAKLPSSFDGVGKKLGEAVKSVVIPLSGNLMSDASKWPGGFVPPSAKTYRGGAAIVLNHLDPPLSAEEIKQRLTQQSLQGLASGTVTYPDFTVESPEGPTRPTSMAVVLANDVNLPYAKDRAKWQEDVVGPVWRLVNEAVSRPAQMQQVKSFNPQVAGDMQRDALIALTASIVVIMIYIWIRFGNLKYGTATVVALLHDTLFTIAALGFSHLLAGTPALQHLAHVLGIEPFRINLTVVAGILTIMGYSMIDTIVVFDRIRENRGKYGLVSRKVINDAVNQTLSRTILTAGTTTVMVAIMYFIGGPGIHGFTFVLLVGILVGTYSSIAIAAPILLLGNRRTEESTTGDRPAGRLQRVGA